MRKFSQKCLAGLLSAVFLVAQTTHASEWEEESGEIAAEFIYRPAGVVLLAGGTAMFVALLPFSLLTGTTKKTAKNLVTKPYKFTFERPVGSGVKDWDSD